MASQYQSIKEFHEGKEYKTTNGDMILIHGVDENHVRFVLNNSIQDMKTHQSFLDMMNGKKYSILDF